MHFTRQVSNSQQQTFRRYTGEDGMSQQRAVGIDPRQQIQIRDAAIAIDAAGASVETKESGKHPGCVLARVIQQRTA
jgi:hypothetical protein